MGSPAPPQPPEISPVIKAFLAAYTAGSEGKSREAEAKARQQQLDQALEEIENRHKEAQDRLDLEHEQLRLNTNKYIMDARQQAIQQLRENPETIVGSPNINALAPNLALKMAIPGMEGQNVLPTNLQSAPEAGSPVSINIPGVGSQVIGMPKSNTQQAVEQQQALLPGRIEEYAKTIGSDKEKQYQLQDQIHKAQIDMLNRQHDLQMQGKDAQMATQLMIAQMKGENEARNLLLRLGYVDPESLQTNVNNYVSLAAMGQLSPEIMKGMNPAEKRLFDTTMASLHYQIPDQKTMATLSDKSSKAVDTMLATDNFLNSNPPPKTLAGKAGAALQNATGLNRAYNNYKATTLANMETALDLPLGRINGSPAIFKNFEPMLVQPFEGGQTVSDKKERMADVLVGGLARSLNKYQPEQRKILLRNILQSNPGIEQNKQLSTRFHRFLDSGTFTPTYPVPKTE